MKLKLPLIKLKITFRLNNRLILPSYAGSALRGVFGSSLKKISCLSEKASCTECGMSKNCPYAISFGASEVRGGNGINPYIIEPPLTKSRVIEAGEELVFHQILFGNAVSKLSFILSAWIKGFQFGIGKMRVSASLMSVYQELPENNIYLYGADNDSMNEIQPVYSLVIPDSAQQLTLKIETPMRIQREGHPIVPEKLTPVDLIAALIRRTKLLYKSHASIPDFLPGRTELLLCAAALMDKKSLHWRDWIRWSSRQNAHIALGGVVGEWELSGDLTPVLPIIYAGQLLHVGKSAVMGMGKYVVL